MDLKRDMHPSFLAELLKPAFYPVLLVDLDWPDAPVRAHSGTGPISWGGHIWSGVGQFGAVEIPVEMGSAVPTDFSLSLVCDLPDLAEYADDVIRQRPGQVWVGATTEPGGNVLIGTPTPLTSGVMDTLILSVDVSQGDAAQPTRTLYQLMVGLTTGPGMRTMASAEHSDEDQRRHYPGDTAGKRLILATSRAEKTLWPAP